MAPQPGRTVPREFRIARSERASDLADQSGVLLKAALEKCLPAFMGCSLRNHPKHLIVNIDLI